MATETPRQQGGVGPTSKAGLKPNAIGFIDGLVIAIASTAPAYSLAAVIGTVVVTVGLKAPAVLLLSFVPMFLIASAFYWMNRADPDCGTTFSWVTRAFGPYAGFMGGWAVMTTGILVIGSLADVAAVYTYALLGLDGAAGSTAAVTTLAVVYIAAMTTVCVLGTELSARMQRVLISAQVVALLLFAIVAVVKVAGDDATAESVSPALSWFSPFDLDREALVAGLLTGVFIYWGWESAVSLTEETKNSITAPGTAAVVSTVILLVTYVGVAVAVVGFAGPAALEAFADDDSVLATVAADVLGTPWDKIVVLAVLSSALASTQTTILPASRTVLSMARADALPTALGQVDRRFRTPVVATVAIGVLATIWYLPAKLISSNFLYDSLTALALLIAFYYALSGLACTVYYRHELRRSVRHAVTIGVAPVVGALLLGYLLVEAVRDQSDPANSYAGTAWLGVGPPLVIGSGALLLGLLVMVGRRLGGHPQFFGRRPFEAVPPDIARDGATVESDAPVLPVAR